MRWIVFLGLFFFLTLSLSACTTLSKKQCQEGNWVAIGKADGEEGYELERFKKHEEACQSFDLPANFAAYKQGRALGLKSYCNVQHQLDLGLHGTRYRPVCSGPIVPLLKQANDWGYRAYEVKANLQASKDQLTDVREKMHEKKVEKEERERLQDEEQRLMDEIDRLRLELVRLKSGAENDLTARTRRFYRTH